MGVSFSGGKTVGASRIDTTFMYVNGTTSVPPNHGVNGFDVSCAVLLEDNKVMLTGGYDSVGTRLDKASVYDLNTGQWTNVQGKFLTTLFSAETGHKLGR